MEKNDAEKIKMQLRYNGLLFEITKYRMVNDDPPLEMIQKAKELGKRLDLQKDELNNIECSCWNGSNQVQDDHIMDGKDKRKHTRIETNNLISQVSLDEEGRYISQGMGRALNVSYSGMLIETTTPILGDRVSLMTVDSDENLIDIVGSLVYCKRTESGMYHSGISFIGTVAETAKYAVKLIKLYHQRKRNMFVKIAA